MSKLSERLIHVCEHVLTIHLRSLFIHWKCLPCLHTFPSPELAEFLPRSFGIPRKGFRSQLRNVTATGGVIHFHCPPSLARTFIVLVHSSSRRVKTEGLWWPSPRGATTLEQTPNTPRLIGKWEIHLSETAATARKLRGDKVRRGSC